MSEMMDFQEAYNELAKQHAELLFAFNGFAALVSGHITTGNLFDREALADEYEHLAEEAGQRLASVAGETPERNPHLQFLADTIRNMGKPVTLRSIEGSKSDGPDAA